MTLVRKVVARFSRGFVLAFHDIGPDKVESLVDAMEPIRPIPLSELVDRSKAGKPTMGLCAITVDDGVGRTIEGLTRMCQRRTWPATFYLPTASLNSGCGMPFEWWRRIVPLLPGRRLDVPSGRMDFSRPEAVRAISLRMERAWHTADLDAYCPLTMQLTEAVARDAGIPLEQLRPEPPISWARVERLSRNDLFQFESHGSSHVAMSVLDTEDLAFEMRVSRDTIREHTGKPCRHLAYPFGSLQSIGVLAPVVARRFYDSAATMSLGHVDAADPWLLPRIPLYSKNSIAMARLKITLKCSRLAGGRPRRELSEEQSTYLNVWSARTEPQHRRR